MIEPEDLGQAAAFNRVVMLVNNPCVNDSRVIKSAEALVKSGWQVSVICRFAANLPILEIINGVTYRRIQPAPVKISDFKAWIGKKQNITSDSVSTYSMVTDQNKPKIRQSLINDRSNSFKKFAILNDAKRWHATFRRKSKGLLSAQFKRIKKFLAFPIKVLYWLNEEEEFKKISLPVLKKMKFEVVHCHDLTTLSTGVAIAKMHRCKLVYDSHELEMHRNANYTKKVWQKRRKLEDHGIRCADAVITVSDSIAEHLAKDYKITRPYVVLNSPDYKADELISRTVRKDLKLAKTTPLAIYVGSVTINRGLENIVQALLLYPNLRFATVGPIRTQTRIELEAIAQSINVADRLFFLPAVKPNEVVPYIVDADVSVLAIQNVCLSYFYCMPNKLLESTFAGVPVAVANLFELEKFVRTYSCGLVMDEKCAASIAYTIKEIITKRKKFQLNEETRAVIAKEYGWTTQSIKLNNIYKTFQ